MGAVLTKRYLVILVAFVAFFATSLPAKDADAFAVEDFLNLVQNTTSAISEVTTTIQQIESVIMQAQQLKLQLQNIKKLNPRSWDELVRAFYEVYALVQQAKSLSENWRAVAQNTERLYGKYKPSVLFGKRFDQHRALWAKNSNDAIKTAIDGDAQVMRAYAKTGEKARALDLEVETISGSLQAQEAMVKYQSLGAQQRQMMLDLILKDHNMRHKLVLESRRRREANNARHFKMISEGMGSHQSTAKAVPLLSFDK